MVLDLTEYKLLSFDIYGTLIDWETGIFDALQSLVEELPANSKYRGETTRETRKSVLGAFSAHEQALQKEQPKLPYNILLTETYKRLATTLGVQAADADAEKFGASVGGYPAFPDTVAAMKRLGSYYKLVVLSNVDNSSFLRTLSGPLHGVHFDAIYTAEMIGSYKPDPGNFRYLIANVEDQFGVQKHQILHTAQSLLHDHVPAKDIGLRPGAWIARGGVDGRESAMGGDLAAFEAERKVQLGAVYGTLGEMADAVEKAFAGMK